LPFGVNTLNLDITLTLDEPGTFGFGGALVGPAGLTIVSRTFGVPVNSWGFQTNLPAAYDGKPITSLLDFGAIETAGTGTLLPVGTTTLMTLVVSGFASLPPHPWPLVFRVGDSSDLGAGAWWSNTGEPILVDSSIPFVIDIPEPATLLLLAGALPFLRRRSV
jgi:hypothetical protein